MSDIDISNISFSDFVIKVVIPARDEAQAIGKVIQNIPSFVDMVIVADNGSTDQTADVARAHGAQVVYVAEPGYGRACLAGITAATPCDIIVFLDGDASDYPEDMAAVLTPICTDNMDMVIGSRIAGQVERGALTPQQIFGNTLACWLMKWIWRGTYTDLGPFRAIRVSGLERLDMQAPTFGWTVEMQVRALKRGLRVCEVPVRYRQRIGKSKISGTIKGVILAGAYILGTIAKEAVIR